MEHDIETSSEIKYDPGNNNIVVGHRDLEIEDYSDDFDYDGYPVELAFTHETGKELLRFIRERQEVMRLLKLHPMSILSPEMQQVLKALETLFPNEEKPSFNG